MLNLCERFTLIDEKFQRYVEAFVIGDFDGIY